jgi:low temperature requirement protein LtrA
MSGDEAFIAQKDSGVTTIELFFDLGFVFTITQLTRVVAEDPTLAGVARSMLIFGNLWWMYGGYVWLTNTVPLQGTRERVLLLVGMAGFLVAALGIPSGFTGGGVALGLGYLLVNAVHSWVLLGRIEGSVLRAMGRLGPFNIATALLVLAAGFTRGTATWLLWTAAFALHWATPYLTDPTLVALRSRHFVERHGLIILIALGESVLAVGASVDTEGVALIQVVAAVCGLVVAAALWWLYFDRDEEGAIEAFDDSEGADRSWLALHTYGYTLMPLLGGIIVFAAGLHEAVVAPDEPTSTAAATLLATGISAYTLSLGVLRARLGIGRILLPLGVAALALPTIVLGTEVASLAQLGALAGILIAACLLNRRDLGGFLRRGVESGVGRS